MKNKILVLMLAATLSCTKSGQKVQSPYSVRDYRTVKLFLDTLNVKIRDEYDSTGSYSVPYILLGNGKKQVLFFGATHVRDVNHTQFRQLRSLFNTFHPDIAFHEGGPIPEDRHYASVDSAILLNGETGVLKVLCDSSGIPMLSGDLNEREEMSALKKTIPKDQIYLYMAVERFLNGYKDGYYPGMSLEEGWKHELIPYIQDAGLELTKEEESFDTLKSIYRRYLGKSFSLDSLVKVYEFYLTDDGMLGDVGRKTKIVRDEALLSSIEQALVLHDRVFVVFGMSHLYAVEPALNEIIQRTGR
ncbi:hypothetical protein WBG78_09255 [Chryseolinea sp. T2]|uniref:hypothetical protein n=1 Tax=Chryseolinea sp. T2 TaxID=3129255 RepID=UPI0030771135